MTKPHVQSTIDALHDVGVAITKLGVERVAEHAGVKPGIVRKFLRDVMQSKNSDIRKICSSVKALSEQEDLRNL